MHKTAATKAGRNPASIGNNQAGTGLDHPFFDDPTPSRVLSKDRPSALRRMFGVEAVYLSRGRLDDVDFVFDDNGPH